MGLQDRPEGPVLMRADGTGGRRLRFFMLRRGTVRILSRRGGCGRRLLLRILLGRAGWRRHTVHDDDVSVNRKGSQSLEFRHE